MPKSVQDKAKQLIHEMYLAPTRKAALAAYDQFISSYQSKFPKACECLEKDKEVLFTFYDFPAQHWPHLRTTNPIESTFASGRLVTMNRGLLPWGKISALPITRRARLQLLSVAYSNCTKLRQGDCSAPCWIRRSSAANSLSTLAIFAMFAPHKFFPSWNCVTTGPPGAETR